MPNLSMHSQEELRTLDQRLQKLLIKAITITDFTIIEGKRTLERQKILFKEGKSKTLDSKHVTGNDPSLAVDVCPYPVDWNDLKAFTHLIGIIKGIAYCDGIKIRCGMDFETFKDYPHIQLV